MATIQVNHRTLKLAQEISKTTVDKIAMRLMKLNDKGVYQRPTLEEVAKYLNNLAREGKINKWVLKGEYEEVYLFYENDIINSLEVEERKANQITEIVKIQCYDQKVKPIDTVPIEISNIKNLFKLPETLFCSGTCIYFLCRNNKVVYVGQAENVHQRLIEHLKDKKFDSVFYIRIPGHQMTKYETALISYLKPEYNKTSTVSSAKRESLAKSILENYELTTIQEHEPTE